MVITPQRTHTLLSLCQVSLGACLIIILTLIGCGDANASDAEAHDKTHAGGVQEHTQDHLASDPHGGAMPISQSVLNVVDTNPEPGVFEAHLSTDEQDVNIDGTTVHALIYKDDNNPAAYAGIPDGIPVPQIVIDVGDTVIVTLTNNIEPNCT